MSAFAVAGVIDGGQVTKANVLLDHQLSPLEKLEELTLGLDLGILK